MRETWCGGDLPSLANHLRFDTWPIETPRPPAWHAVMRSSRSGRTPADLRGRSDRRVRAEQLAQRSETDTQPEPNRTRAELAPGAASRLRGRARRLHTGAPLSQVVRVAAIVVWTTALAYHVVIRGVPFDPPLVLLWTVSAAVAFSIGRRAIWTVVMDFVPLAMLLLAWVYLRGAATSFGRPALWTPQITFDKTVFLGVEPTV